MHATDSPSEWQRLEQWMIWIGAIVILLFLLVPVAADKGSIQHEPAERSTHPLKEVELPFNAWNIAEYFSTSLEMSAEKRPNGRLVFENQQGTVPEDYWRIEIWPESKSIVVQFTVGGDYGLSLAREFFESPLFERDETLKLYELLSAARNSAVAELPQFTVCMAYGERTNLQMLNLKFVPLKPRADKS